MGRGGAVEQGLGITVNNARSGGWVVLSLLGSLGGQEIVYFGGSRVCYTHLGCFGT